MARHRKPLRLAAFSLALLFLFSLNGCTTGGASANMEPTKELTVCVDPWAHKTLQRAYTKFMQENRDVKLNFTILPDIYSGTEYKPEEREAALSQLRTQVMAGLGPDLFILESDAPIPLYQDIEKAMRGGVFCDLLPLFSQADFSMDDYIAPVMAAGQVGSKQYVVPLKYQVFGVMTNDATRKILGDEAFKSTSAMLESIRALREIPGMGPVFGHSWVNLLKLFSNPFLPMSPKPADYDALTAQVDTPLLRDILETCKSVYNRTLDMPDTFPPGIAQEYWEDYPRTDAYFAFLNNLDAMAVEAGLSEKYAGITPHLDAFPSEDGGTAAQVTLYAGIRANSPNKYNAVNLLKQLLSAECQTDSSSDMLSAFYGWPVRKGVLEDCLQAYMKMARLSVYHSDFSSTMWSVAFEDPLSDESVNNFLAIEAKITSAAFPLPDELVIILNDYWNDTLDLDTALARMQDYYDKSLEE
jgi:ABC-type glycerol-3-phosphate transport system substrate-binding protein